MPNPHCFICAGEPMPRPGAVVCVCLACAAKYLQPIGPPTSTADAGATLKTKRAKLREEARLVSAALELAADDDERKGGGHA